MSAGRGILHSEFNPSDKNPVHLFQIWIEPAATGVAPSYEQIAFDASEKQGKLRMLAGPKGGAGVATIGQDAQVFAAELGNGEQVVHSLKAGRGAWLHVIKGGVEVNGNALSAGDAVAVSDEPRLEVKATAGDPSEILLFDLA